MGLSENNSRSCPHSRRYAPTSFPKGKSTSVLFRASNISASRILRIIPGISISSLAEVRSLLLIKHKSTPAITSVALDTTSRTSVALTKILLQAKMGLRPSSCAHPPDPVAMLERCDAALLIGDPALKVRLHEYETLDLAEMWVGWQQKPFVCCSLGLPGGRSFPA